MSVIPLSQACKIGLLKLSNRTLVRYELAKVTVHAL